MRTLSAICLIALMVGSFATTSYKVMSPMNTKPARNIVSVMTQVESMMTNGGPIELVHDLLNQFEDEITAEQAAHDGLHEASVVDYANESDFRRREVNDAVATLREAEATLQGAEDQTRRANSDLKSAQGALIETNARLLVLYERREQEAAQFGADQTSYEFAVALLEDVTAFLEELLSGEGEFEELIQKGTKLMKSAIKTNRVASYGSAFAVLAALSTKNTAADSELFEQARNIFNNLLEAEEANWVDRVALEEQLIAENEESVAATLEIVAELEQHIENLKIELVNLNRIIVTQTGVAAAATAKRDRNQNLWDESTELFESQNVFYEEAKVQRRQERDIIDAVRQKVQLRWG